MSSLNDCINVLNFISILKTLILFFFDYFKKWINGKYHNLYLAASLSLLLLL